jgi:hypothetical protein
MQRHGIYTIFGIAFCYIGRYGGDFVEKFGSRFMDTNKSLLMCLFFFFSWAIGKVYNHKYA